MIILSIANRLRGAYKSDKYKEVIIPMTIIRRFECALEGTKEKVLSVHKTNPDIPGKMLQRLSGFAFYNLSDFTLSELLNDPDNISANFKLYIDGFSDNVRDIIKNLDFEKQIDKLEKNDRLYSVIQGFASLDLNPKTVDNVKMGYIFEDLIRRFSENAEAGDHYTGRDIIKTMVSILLAEGCDDIFQNGKVITIVDQACGTGGMLSTSYNYIRRYNPTADIRLFGQEVNDESYAICLAEMLIKGQLADNIVKRDTFKVDAFPDQKMRFVIENPPFGTPWGGKDAPTGAESAVRNEHAKGLSGRWGAGLPSTGDAQLLFVQSAVHKMDDQVGRAAIIENGSPLFSGSVASSGESQIRRWLLEQDLLEAIIALPTDMFYNTSIATYIWILSKNKRPERRGKVQLINATSFYKKLKKTLGKKRKEISIEDRKTITELYSRFENNEYSKIVPREEFMYREYTVMQPLQRNYAVTSERINNLINSGLLNSFYDDLLYCELSSFPLSPGSKEKKKLDELLKNKPVFDSIIKALTENVSDEVYLDPKPFEVVLKRILKTCDINKKIFDKILDGLSLVDKKAKIQTKRNGEILYDKATSETEIVRFNETIESYMEREVLPYVPDAQAFFEESSKKPKIGAEIPFVRYFYKYQQPVSSEVLAKQFLEIEHGVSAQISELFKDR